MVDVNLLKESMNKACDALINTQESNGSWITEEAGGPKFRLYNHPIILTSQALHSLIFNAKPEYTKSIRKGLHYCYNAKIEHAEDIDLHAWQLAALNFSNAEVYKEKKENILRWILSQQRPEGFWLRFPKSNYLTNYSVFQALKIYKLDKKTTSSFRKWMIKAKCKDGYGWGFEPNEEKSYIMATADVILILISAGEDPLSEDLQKARQYIEDSQEPKGYWIGKFTDDLENSHATASAALTLMLLSDNPFNEKVEKAIEYLLSTQTEEGYYLRKAIHPVRYTNQLFSFYLYLKETWNSTETELLKNILKPQQVMGYLWKRFAIDTKQKLLKTVYQSVLDSRVLGTTERAVERRKDIMSVLSTYGAKNVAEIIDLLKEKEGYSHLKKKSHLTQIKSDVEFLKDIKLVQQDRHKYYSEFEFRF